MKRSEAKFWIVSVACLLLILMAGSPASAQVQVKIGDKESFTVQTVGLDASKSLTETVGVHLPAGPESLVPLKFLAVNELVFPEAHPPVQQAIVLRWVPADKKYLVCQGLPLPDPSTPRVLRVQPSAVECHDGDGLPKGGVVAVQFEGGQTLLVGIPNRIAPIPGSDLGIGLTVVDSAHDGEGFRFDGSPFVYYSVSKIRLNRFRVVTHLAALDMFDDVDLETGLGVGLLFRPNETLTAGPNGFGLAAGAGYNLMADDSSDGWYAFVGFSWNFNTDKTEGK